MGLKKITSFHMLKLKYFSHLQEVRESVIKEDDP